jgi:hypothetical protein
LVVAETEYVCLVTSAARWAESDTVMTGGVPPPVTLDPQPQTIKLKARKQPTETAKTFIPKLLFQNGM